MLTLPCFTGIACAVLSPFEQRIDADIDEKVSYNRLQFETSKTSGK